MPNKNFDAWDSLFVGLNLDTSKDCHEISVDQIKAIARREPRLIAKMDSSSDVPPILRRYGYFLLPTSRSTYLLIRGNGYHRLEPLKGAPVEYTSKIKFRLETSSRSTSEMQYLDYSANAGLIEQIVNGGELYPIIRGRESSGKQEFSVNRTKVLVNNAQIEVDLGLEGSDSIVLLEGKSKTPEDFIIRQLYYPYKKFIGEFGQKKVLPIFFTYEVEKDSYNYWQYRFEDPADYNSIALVGSQSYVIRERDVWEIEDITDDDLHISQSRTIIPQANDLDKVQQLVYQVSKGMTSAHDIARYFGFDKRQSSYYREAAEALGFVAFRNRAYTLTEAGRRLVALDMEQRNILFAKAVNEFELFKACMDQLQSKGYLRKRDIEFIIARMSDLSSTTITRRAASIQSWLRWVANRTGTFTIKDNVFVLS